MKPRLLVCLCFLFFSTNLDVFAQTNSAIQPVAKIYSPSLKVWTNPASLFVLASNLLANSGDLDRAAGRKLMLEIGHSGYAPAALWIASKYAENEDPEGKLGIVIEKGYRDSRNTYPYVKMIKSGGNVMTYEGVDPYDEEEEKWYRKAAELGNVEAQYKLGQFLATKALHQKPDEENSSESPSGRKSQTLKESIKWYQMAADRGNKQAKLALARVYAEGRGIAKSSPKALQLYEQVESFYEMARLNLANTNRVAAYTWWCVGNAREKPSGAPFTSNYASITFSSIEMAAGRRRADEYLLQRYGSTNAVSIGKRRPSPSRKAKSTSAQTPE